jgi:phosphate-selective porin OprO/OprP
MGQAASRKGFRHVAGAAAFLLLLAGGRALAQDQEPDGLRSRVEKLEKQNEKLEQQNEELMRLLRTLPQLQQTGAPGEPQGPGAGGPVNRAGELSREPGGPPGPRLQQGPASGEFVAVGSDLAFRASWEDGFVARTANDDFRFHMGGKVQQDWGAFVPNAHFNQIFPGQWDTGADFRSLRLRGDGSAYEIVDFVLEMDFISQVTPAVNFPTPTDVYFDVKQIPLLGTFRAGHFKEPFSLERYGTSETDLTFMERSSAHDAFDPVRNIGMMFYNTGFDERMTWASGVFRSHSDTNSGNTFDYANHGLATTTRVTFNPWYENDGRCVFMFGGAYSWRGLDPDDTGNIAGVNPSRARFFSRMPLRIGSPTLVDTTNLLGDEYQLFNAQALLISGPFSLQAEFDAAQVNNLNRGLTPAKKTLFSNPSFNGFYVQASYFLTGENRIYLPKIAGIGTVRPYENFFFVRDEDGQICRGWGAWEVGFRYDYLNLTSASLNALPGASAVTTAGVLQSATIGVNWYLNPNFKVQWDYAHTWRADANIVNGNGAVDGVGMRFNWAF